MACKFELEHIGINTPNAEEAARLAQLLSMMFNLEPRHGQKSEFGGPYFECMKAPFLGSNGHIAMRTPRPDRRRGRAEGEGLLLQHGHRRLLRRRPAEERLPRRGIRRFAIHIMGKMSVLSRRRALQPWGQQRKIPLRSLSLKQKPEADASGFCRCAAAVPGSSRAPWTDREYQSHSKRPPPCQLDPGKAGAFSFTPYQEGGAPRRTESRPYK